MRGRVGAMGGWALVDVLRCRLGGLNQIVHAVSIDLDATADLRFNDFIGPITDIGLSPSTAILTCNYWGNPLGPQVFPVGLETIFTAFATEPIARTGASGC